MKTVFVEEPNKKVYYLVVAIAVLSAIAAAVSLFYNPDVNVGQKVKTISGQTIQLYGRGIYHNDSLSMAVQAKGQDLVTLFLGVPFLTYSLYLSGKDSLKGSFYLTGTLAYFLYSYTIYCFSGNLNSFFIIYVTITGLSFFAFVSCMISFNFGEMKEAFTTKLPIGYLGISNIVFALLIGMNWLSRLKAPASYAYLEHYTTFPIQAIDLGFVLPAIIFSSVMLIRRQNWGYFLIPIMTMKILTLLIALDAMILFMYLNKVEVSLIEIIIFPLYTLIVIFNFYLIQKNLNYKS
ncbi:hypothetical protein [Lactobacillus sp. UCMA15818]|uniref:hypothetical protein n=1 Tax=Lactobacillus sp. UCMA15818 TaxID=2583394 RepID=UPI0025B05E91|nr:hypothetical protein [Lactobacillus sp. UCMA15818]MDN2453566.1 hypothetical protein [Lactobacillus sp. UCMA15818]